MARKHEERRPRLPRARLAGHPRWRWLMAATALMVTQAHAFSLREIGEWVVSCDNAATCSAVNASQLTQLRAAQPSPFGLSRICIHRPAKADAEPQFFVTLRSNPPKNFAARQEDRLLRVVGSGSSLTDIAMEHRGVDHWQVPPHATRTLLASLGKGTQLHVVARDGAILERLSVQGLDQALSIIDRAQERSGTVTALREQGAKAPAPTPSKAPLPTLVTASLPRLAPPLSPSPEALRLRRAACGTPGLDASAGYRLLGDQNRPDRTLWVTPCDSQQGLRRAYFVIEHKDGSAAPVDFPGARPERPSGLAGLLTLPEIDAETGRVRELWREITPPGADKACLIQRLWGWNGRSFELAEEHRSLSCAGFVTGYWPKTYTRPLVTPARPGTPAIAASFQPPC